MGGQIDLRELACFVCGCYAGNGMKVIWFRAAPDCRQNCIDVENQRVATVKLLMEGPPTVTGFNCPVNGVSFHFCPFRAYTPR